MLTILIFIIFIVAVFIIIFIVAVFILLTLPKKLFIIFNGNNLKEFLYYEQKIG